LLATVVKLAGQQRKYLLCGIEQRLAELRGYRPDAGASPKPIMSSQRSGRPPLRAWS
jgi:hypothetical protein